MACNMIWLTSFLEKASCIVLSASNWLSAAHKSGYAGYPCGKRIFAHRIHARYSPMVSADRARRMPAHVAQPV